MKRISAISCLLFLFLFAGMSCEETVLEPTFTVGKEINVRLNQLYTSADGHHSIRLTEINDSRCPEGLMCIWQGEVTIKGEWFTDGRRSTFEIHSVIRDQQQQPDGYTIQIVDAKPYPKAGSGSKPEELVVTLLIVKNG